jgi:UDP-glucose 4-epimerase
MSTADQSESRPWLVTGAAGFLGSHVVDYLSSRGTPVVALDGLQWGRLDFLRPALKRPGCTLAVADIRDPAAVRTVFEAFRPANVVHLAALHYIPAAMKDPALAIGSNVLGTQVLLSAAMAAGAERFWFASTGDVYPPSREPHREDDPTGPFNIYGLSKLQGEQLLALTAKSHPDARFVVGRLFNLYGPRETNPHFLPELLKQIAEDPGRTLRLGNLWPKRDLVPTADAARAVVASLEAAPPGLTTVNVATGVATSMQEVIDLIGKVLGKKLAVEMDPAKARPVERDHLQADVSRLRALIGWTPHADLERGVSELLAAEGLVR